MRSRIMIWFLRGIIPLLMIKSLIFRVRQSKTSQVTPTRLIGYVRLSNARTEEERGKVLRPEPDASGRFVRRSKPDYLRYHAQGTSIARQKENIRKLAEAEGFTVQIFEDVGGKRSGRSTEKRPGWNEVEARLRDREWAGLIINDLSRAHRKSLHLLELLERLQKLGKSLYLADPERSFYGKLDINSFLLRLVALLDEWYAEEGSLRQKSRARFRAEHGITGGMAPFGTYRNPITGYLALSQRGAWWLPVPGQFLEGIPSESPHPEAVWRKYADTAEQILRRFGEAREGYHTIAATLVEEGYPFQNRWGEARLLTQDDVRRVVNNWPTYGGLVGGGRSRLQLDPNWRAPIAAVALVEERAVFPIDLLKTVARRQQYNHALYGERRRIVETSHGVNLGTACYPLRDILYCKTCLETAASIQSSALRGWQGGMLHRGVRRYRHRAGDRCGCRALSLPATQIEAQVADLLADTKVRAEVRPWLQRQLLLMRDQLSTHTYAQQEQTRQRQIDQCRKRIRNLKACLDAGDYAEVEYERRVAALFAQLEQLQQQDVSADRATSPKKVLVALDQLGSLWKQADLRQQKQLSQLLFQRIVYDFDQERMVSVELQPLFASLLILPQLPQ